MDFSVAYIPIGVGTYHMESAKEQFEKSKKALLGITDAVVFPDDILLTVDAVSAFLDTINPDLVVLQNVTFANGAYANEILRRFSCPILLWTLREPVIDGGRLRLNSLTGAYSAANMITAFRGDEKFAYVFGGADEDKVKEEIKAVVDAAHVLKKMKNLKMCSVGHTPQGFGFGRALDSEISKAFGVTLESIEARELIERAKSYAKEDCSDEAKEANETVVGLEETPEKNRTDFAKLLKAYRTYFAENNIGAVSSRCWPDFFTSYGTPVCTVLSMLNAEGIPAACESDTYGALSMYIGKELSGGSCFFGDPVSMDEKEGTITYWHCGMAACDLAREDTGAKVGVHPNRKIGPVMDFGCKPAKEVTIFRVGRKPDGTFRFFIAEGEALDKPKQFNGTSIVVKTCVSAEKVVKDSIKDGWEPHFVVVYGAVGEALKRLAEMLHMEVWECRKD